MRYLDKLRQRKEFRKKKLEIKTELFIDREVNVNLVVDIANNFQQLLNDPRYTILKTLFDQLKQDLSKELLSKPIDSSSETLRAQVALLNILMTMPKEYIDYAELIRKGKGDQDDGVSV